MFFTHQDMVLEYLTLYFRLVICLNRDGIFGTRIVLYKLASIDLKQTRDITVTVIFTTLTCRHLLSGIYLPGRTTRNVVQSIIFLFMEEKPSECPMN